MTSSSNINFSSMRARLKKAEKSLESDSKSKIFNKKYMESHEAEILAQTQSLGVSYNDIQDILNSTAKYVSETLGDASETLGDASEATKYASEPPGEYAIDLTRTISESYKEAQKVFIDIMNSKYKLLEPYEMIEAYNKSIAEYFAAVTKLSTNISVSIANFYTEIFDQLFTVTAHTTKMFGTLFKQTDDSNNLNR
jgi:hypothetical protein